MSTPCRHVVASFALFATLASAQEIAVLRDLDAQGRVTLTKEQLIPLLTDAKMSRTTGKGNLHFWKNDASGSFVISSNNADKQTRNTTAPGKWHISDDGRYCVLIDWKVNPTEEWCRYVVKAGADYYGAKSDKTGTEKVYKLEISK